MLDVAEAKMLDLYKKRNVSANRRFPKGCGRYAPPLEMVLSEEIKDNGAPEVEKNFPGETLVMSTAKEGDNSQIQNQEPAGITEHSQDLEPIRVGKSNDGEQEALGLLKKTTVDEIVETSAVELSTSRGEKALKLSVTENPMETPELSRGSVVGSFAGEEVNDINDMNPVISLDVAGQKSGLPNCSVSVYPVEIDDGVSKLYGPSKRRKGFVNRRFPVGCGRSACIMTREECLKLLAAAPKTDELKPVTDVVLKGQDTSDGKLQGRTNWGASQEEKEISLTATMTEEAPKNKNSLEEGKGAITNRNVFELALMESSTNMGKKDISTSPSTNSHENDVWGDGDNTGTKELNHEEKFRKIISTEAQDEKEEKKVYDILEGHASMGHNALGKDGPCLEEKLDKGIVERDVSGNQSELLEIVKKARSMLSEIEEELMGHDKPKDIETLQPPMTSSSCHWRQRLQDSTLLENIVALASGVNDKMNLTKRKYLAKKSWLSGKMKAKQQVRTSKRKLLSVGELPLKRRNKSLEAPQNSHPQGEKDDSALPIISIREDLSINLPSFVSSCSSLNRISDDELPEPITVKKSSEKSSSMGKIKSKKQVRRAKKKFLLHAGLDSQPWNTSIEETDASLASCKDANTALDVRPLRTGYCIDLPPFGSSLVTSFNDEMSYRMRVRKTLRLFQCICRKLLQNEESSSKNHGQKNRIDFAAMSILKEKNLLPDTGGPITGPVPGVEVGDQFHYRAELRLVGLHRSYQGGIDFTRINRSLIALSIVASVGEADDMDNSDFLIYSGSGGRPAEGDKPPEDQKLERGNLALKNSIEAKTPVRVIRRCKDLGYDDSLDGKPKQLSTFTYDGLYLVEEYWLEKGPQGFSLYKFKLRRIPGQPEIALMDVRLKSGETRGLCIEDISKGTEKIPIPVVNTIDDERPMPFTYIVKMIYPSWYEPMVPMGCNCRVKCSDSGTCSCAHKNGGEIPFNFNGAIVQAKPLVYECGPGCQCPPSCYNRVSQQGIRFRLEVFKTPSRGWGVRSLNSIPSGSFICEYMGELLQDMDAEQRSNDEYLFDIGRSFDDHDFQGGPSTSTPDSQDISKSSFTDNGGFTIDAAHYGNVGRFINHSCSPNLYAQNIIYDHDDKRMPHILFFAAENIPPLKELTYDYNYTIGQVLDSDGNTKRKDCHCGSDMCVGRLY